MAIESVLVEITVYNSSTMVDSLLIIIIIIM